MKKILLLIGICAIIILIGFLIYQTFLNYQQLIKESGKPLQKPQEPLKDSEKEKEPEVPDGGLPPRVIVPKALEGKSIAMIIAFKDFRDEEYAVPRGVFRAAGAEIKVASNQLGTAIGADGGTVEVELLVKDLNPADFDAVVFIGGSGALKYLDNEDSYKVARETVSKDKLLAAICISPTILAKAGVLDGKKATVWSSQMDKSPIGTLQENGAIYQDVPVVADEKIVTGNGPEAAEEFAMTIVELLP